MPRLLLVLLLAVSAAAAEVPPHLQAARALVAAVDPARNFYGGGPVRIVWPEGNAVAENRSVCSSFLRELLDHTGSLKREDLATACGVRLPEAADIHRGLADGRFFTLLQRVQDLLPGDIIAIDYRSNGANPTGHVMLVDTAPVADGDGRWLVSVIDSTGTAHGSDDTRWRDGQAGAGVGRGTIVLASDASGLPTGFRSGTDAHHHPLHAAVEQPIRLARLGRKTP